VEGDTTIVQKRRMAQQAAKSHDRHAWVIGKKLAQYNL
jgi:hypothetical protein